MRNLRLSQMLFSIGLLVTIPVHAAEVNGVWIKNVRDWAKREAICSRALGKENNEIVVYERDIFIVKDNEIIGASAKCKIKARKDDGQLIRLLVACPSEIAENQLTFRADGPDEMTRIFPGMTQMNTKYFRCPEGAMP